MGEPAVEAPPAPAPESPEQPLNITEPSVDFSESSEKQKPGPKPRSTIDELDILAEKLAECPLTDREMTDLLPPHYLPRNTQRRYVLSALVLSPLSSRREVTEHAGLNINTVTNWFQRNPKFCKWLRNCWDKAMSREGLRKLWYRCWCLGMKGSTSAMRMYFERFDPGYGRVVEAPKPEALTPEMAELARQANADLQKPAIAPEQPDKSGVASA